jgi:hypothetical protein
VIAILAFNNGLGPLFSGFTNLVPNSMGSWKASKLISYPAGGMKRGSPKSKDFLVIFIPYHPLNQPYQPNKPHKPNQPF